MKILTVFILLISSIRPAIADQAAILKQVGVKQNINHELPLNTVFYDQAKKRVKLKNYFNGKPVLMTFIYFSCPMLCPLNLKSLAQSLQKLDLKPGKDFQMLAVSFDPNDLGGDSQAEYKRFMKMYGRPDYGGIHFLTGVQSSIDKLTTAAGFTFVKNEDTGQYAHTTALLVANPKGRIARYFFGLAYPVRDIKLALTEAQENKTGSLTQVILLYCFHYFPQTGRYTLAILNLLKIAAVLMLIVLTVLFLLLRGQEKRSP